MPRAFEEVADRAAKKRAPLNMKASPELRSRVEDAARRSGLSLSQEVERRLLESFQRDDMAGGQDNETFLHFAAAYISEAEDTTGAKWTKDPLTWEVVRSGILTAIDRRRPDPDPDPDPDPAATPTVKTDKNSPIRNFLGRLDDIVMSPEVVAWLNGKIERKAKGD